MDITIVIYATINGIYLEALFKIRSWNWKIHVYSAQKIRWIFLFYYSNL